MKKTELLHACFVMLVITVTTILATVADDKNLVGGAVNSADRHGTYVELEIALTAKGVPVKVQVSTEKPAAKSGYYQRTDVPQVFSQPRRIVFDQMVSRKDGSGFAKKFNARIEGLSPNTTYYYALKAEGQDGAVSLFIGEFKTLVRVATIFVDSLHVTDDSDPLGSGELSFSFFVADEFAIKLPTNAPSYKTLASGQTLNFPNNKFFITVGLDALSPPKQNIIFRVTGFDDDSVQTVCGTGANKDPNQGNGKNDCGEWSSGSRALPFAKSGGAPLKTGAEEMFETPFTLKVVGGSGSTVAFEVTGRLKVFYV